MIILSLTWIPRPGVVQVSLFFIGIFSRSCKMDDPSSRYEALDMVRNNITAEYRGRLLEPCICGIGRDLI